MLLPPNVVSQAFHDSAEMRSPADRCLLVRRRLLAGFWPESRMERHLHGIRFRMILEGALKLNDQSLMLREQFVLVGRAGRFCTWRKLSQTGNILP